MDPPISLRSQIPLGILADNLGLEHARLVALCAGAAHPSTVHCWIVKLQTPETPQYMQNGKKQEVKINLYQERELLRHASYFKQR